jgi:hypothetical protein
MNHPAKQYGIMVQANEQRSEAETMDECTRQRRRLAGEFLQLQKVFIALGDETRQQIFVTLLQNETVGMRVPEITKCTHLSRPAVSHHLQVLKNAGLIGCTGRNHELLLCRFQRELLGSSQTAGGACGRDGRPCGRAGYPGLKEDEAP